MDREEFATLYGFGGFFRLVWMLIRSCVRRASPFRMRRALVLSFVLPGLFLLEVVHRLALLLDEVLFPAFRNVRVREPVFIMGVPRSGTTLFHHLLAKDTAEFATFDLWELVFAPAIVERRFWQAMAALDRALGGCGRKLLGRLDDKFFEGMRKIHPASFFAPEEDEVVLLPIFASVFLLPVFPFPDELRYLTHFDTTAPPEDRKRIMDFYKRCIQRHLYVHGPNKRFLSKNPCFSSKIDALGETFPDAKVVCNVRTPYEAAPSLVSLIAYSWDQFGNDRQGNRLRDVLIEVMGHYYRHPLERLSLWPERRYVFLKYDDLVRDPRQAVTDVYTRFGFEISLEFDACLREERDKARAFKSRHAYSLDQYDLNAGDIRRDFQDVFDRFGFDPNIEG